MTDEQFRALRTLILDQNVKIEALSLEIRNLKKAIEATDVVYVGPEDVGSQIEIPDDVRKLIGL